MTAVTGLFGSSLLSSPASANEPFAGIMQAVSKELSSSCAYSSLSTVMPGFGDELLRKFCMSVLIYRFLIIFAGF